MPVKCAVFFLKKQITTPIWRIKLLEMTFFVIDAHGCWCKNVPFFHGLEKMMVDLFLSDLPSGHAVLAVDCQQALLLQQGEWMMQAAIGGISSSPALGMLLADKVGGVGVMSHPDDYPPRPPKLMASSVFELQQPRVMATPGDDPPIPPKMNLWNLAPMKIEAKAIQADLIYFSTMTVIVELPPPPQPK